MSLLLLPVISSGALSGRSEVEGNRRTEGEKLCELYISPQGGKLRETHGVPKGVLEFLNGMTIIKGAYLLS